MTPKRILTSSTIGIALLFFVAGIYAAVADVVKIKADYEHTKGTVEFHHKKHAEEYAKQFPDLYKDGCGACHHDENNKPLAGLTADSKVHYCIDCHKKPGEVPKEIKDKWRAEKIKKEEKKKLEMEYHAEAIHENCQGCHKAYNKQYKPKEKAPTTCTACHPKE